MTSSFATGLVLQSVRNKVALLSCLTEQYSTSEWWLGQVYRIASIKVHAARPAADETCKNCTSEGQRSNPADPAMLTTEQCSDTAQSHDEHSNAAVRRQKSSLKLWPIGSAIGLSTWPQSASYPHSLLRRLRGVSSIMP